MTVSNCSPENSSYYLAKTHSSNSQLSLSSLIVVIVSDNPSTTAGPPIGLGWSYDQTHETCDVDAYEKVKQPRSKKEFLLPSSERWEILRLTGNYSNNDLKRASDEVKKRQAQRRKS